jgi:hypothetical protein
MISVRTRSPLAMETLSLSFIPYTILDATINISIRYRYPRTLPPSHSISKYPFASYIQQYIQEKQDSVSPLQSYSRSHHHFELVPLHIKCTNLTSLSALECFIFITLQPHCDVIASIQILFGIWITLHKTLFDRAFTVHPVSPFIVKRSF